jgi:acetyl esterase/lipase
MLRSALVACTLVVSAIAAPAGAQPRVDRNVVYGMVSGTALLLDVYRPAQPNGLGLIAIQGSGWHQPTWYDAPPLKERPEVTSHAERFAAAGYTVFVINHRSAPRFRFPDPIDDAQRAVRFIRAKAAEYGIAEDRIGAWGSSSGGHLVELLGTLDGGGNAADADPVNRQSAKVQTVVALFAPSDLIALYQGSTRRGMLASLMGFPYVPPVPGISRDDDAEARAYRAASPTTHVTADDAPMLLFHGDSDEVVPVEQSQLMEQALHKAGVEVRFVRVPGGKHGADFQLPAGHPRRPDEIRIAIAWFDAHLKTAVPQSIAIPMNDGRGPIAADLYGSGERAVLLLHGGRRSKSHWQPQAEVLARAGFRVMAIDFRAWAKPGSDGDGGCGYDAGCLAKDVLAAIRYLRESGAKTVSLVGGSLGGGAAAQASFGVSPGDVDRSVLLAPMAIDHPERVSTPVLVILARDDASGSGPRLPEIRAQHERATGPKELVVVDGSAHAQFLFESPQGPEVLDRIVRFLTTAAPAR